MTEQGTTAIDEQGSDEGARASRDLESETKAQSQAGGSPEDGLSDSARSSAQVEDSGESEAGNLDVEKLNLALNLTFRPEALNPSPANAGGPAGTNAELFEELAEDMLELLRRVKSIEVTCLEMSGRLAQVEQTLRDGSRLQARETDALRRDLLADRKAANAVSVFTAVVPTLDSLRLMHTNLHQTKDARTRAQLYAVIEALSMVLRGLGFLEFRVEKGEVFDPGRMECLGFGKGEPGIVLEVTRPGYQAYEAVIRPVGVLIGDPHSAPEE
jgi:molecular chaperone GrpE (heat shock protein)